MGSRKILSQTDRERIYEGKLQGKTIGEMAQELRCSKGTVRKWYRRMRDKGIDGLKERKRGRPKKGTLSTFSAEVREEALMLKRQHKRWGADRVRTDLQEDARFTGLPLPSRSCLSVYFKEQCPESLMRYKKRQPPVEAPPKADAVHEIWELDSQEKIELADGSIATICNIRDPFGAAIIASQAFSVKTEKHWRKLKIPELQQVLRNGFVEWGTLPDEVLTDNELVLAGSVNDPFPSRLTLWLVGLGIVHGFIRPHCPTDQPEIERCHRTLDGFVLDSHALTNLNTLQQTLDRERSMYNHHFPSRASDCDGHPPLQAHPELLQPRRPYALDQEWRLFNMQRIYDFLAAFAPFQRKVNSTGQVSLGNRMYTVGRPLASQTLYITFDAQAVEWVFCLKIQDSDNERFQEVARRSPKNLDFSALTGLTIPAVTQVEPIQLTLPFLAPGRGTIL